jgi:hypothetical protein
MAQRSTATTTASVERSPITIAAGFVGAFVVASLAVQMVRSMSAAQPVSATSVQAVVGNEATLWQEFGSR